MLLKQYALVFTIQTLVKSFEITEQPVRAAKFVGRKQWLLTGQWGSCDTEQGHIHCTWVPPEGATDAWE